MKTTKEDIFMYIQFPTNFNDDDLERINEDINSIMDEFGLELTKAFNTGVIERMTDSWEDTYVEAKILIQISTNPSDSTGYNNYLALIDNFSDGADLDLRDIADIADSILDDIEQTFGKYWAQFDVDWSTTYRFPDNASWYATISIYEI